MIELAIYRIKTSLLSDPSSVQNMLTPGVSVSQGKKDTWDEPTVLPKSNIRTLKPTIPRIRTKHAALFVLTSLLVRNVCMQAKVETTRPATVFYIRRSSALTNSSEVMLKCHLWASQSLSVLLNARNPKPIKAAAIQ